MSPLVALSRHAARPADFRFYPESGLSAVAFNVGFVPSSDIKLEGFRECPFIAKRYMND